jgi:hypothetical protein
MKKDSRLYAFLNFMLILLTMIVISLINTYEFFRMCYYQIFRISYVSYKQPGFPLWVYRRKDKDSSNGND